MNLPRRRVFHADGPSGIIDTDCTIGRDNIEGSLGPFGFDIHNPVFGISALAVIGFVIFTLALPDAATPSAGCFQPLPRTSTECFSAPQMSL
jgi:hypothetical protein